MAKRFNFKLQNVLDLKKFKRDLLYQSLSRLLNELAAEKSELDRLMAEFEKTKSRLIKELLGNDNNRTIFYYRDYLDFLDSEITGKKNMISIMEEVILKKRQEVERAEKEKKVVEKLKYKKFKQYNKDLNIRQQKTADEISLQRFIYNREGVI